MAKVDVHRAAADTRILLELMRLHRWPAQRMISACTVAIGHLVREHAEDFAGALRVVIRNFEDAIVAIAEERKN